MIVTLLLNMIYGILWVILAPVRLLPDITLSNSFITSIETASGYLSSLNNFVPIDTIITLLGIFIAIELAYLSYKLIMWFVKRFPTQS